jgi:hypothetical protein
MHSKPLSCLKSCFIIVLLAGDLAAPLINRECYKAEFSSVMQETNSGDV